MTLTIESWQTCIAEALIIWGRKYSKKSIVFKGRPACLNSLMCTHNHVQLVVTIELPKGITTKQPASASAVLYESCMPVPSSDAMVGVCRAVVNARLYT